MKLALAYYGDPVLRKKGKKITQFDEQLKQLAQAMMVATVEWEGWGLAAHQVGRPLQLFVINLQGLDPEPDMEFSLDGELVPLERVRKLVVVNPILHPVGLEADTEKEGCLSLPDYQRSPVKRPRTIELSYQDETGAPHVLRCNHWLARAIQHEYDHLHGVLYIDYGK